MNVQEAVGVAQSAAITAAFLFAVWQAPRWVTQWFQSKKQLAEMEAAEAARMRAERHTEREGDQALRHEARTEYQRVIADIFLQHQQTADKLARAIDLLRESLHTFCRAPGGPRRGRSPADPE